MTTQPDCRGCLTARVKARRMGGWQACRECGAEWQAPEEAPEPMPAQRFAPDPPPPLPPIERAGWVWVPNVRADMAALMWCPGANDPVGSFLETDVEREEREERRSWRARHARMRLDAMTARGDDGRRAAQVVRYVYGERGEKLDERESCAVLVADRWAWPGERAAYREQIRQRNPRQSQASLDAMAPIGFGNALIGACVASYERDEWTPVVDPTEAREADRSMKRHETRAEFVARMQSALKAAQEEFAEMHGRMLGRYAKRRLNST